MVTRHQSEYNASEDLLTIGRKSLQLALSEINAATEHVVSENEMMVHYMEKHSILYDPQEDALGRHRSFTLRMRTKSLTMDRLQGLSATQKCNIAATEGDFIGQKIQSLREESEKILESFNNVLQCLLIRRAEIQKQFVLFNWSVLRGDVQCDTDVPKAEKVLKYQEKFMQSRENLILQLRLENPLLREKIKRLEAWCRRTAQNDDRPKRVDFECIQRANVQCAEDLQNLNNKLRQSKVMSSNAIYFKRKYQEILKNEIDDRDRCLKRVVTRLLRSSTTVAYTDLICKEMEIEKYKEDRLIYRMNNFRVPAMSSFIQAEMELKTLGQKQQVAERQKRLAQMTYTDKKSRVRLPEILPKYSLMSPHSRRYVSRHQNRY